MAKKQSSVTLNYSCGLPNPQTLKSLNPQISHFQITRRVIAQISRMTYLEDLKQSHLKLTNKD